MDDNKIYAFKAPALEGVSRDGLIVDNWATKNPTKIGWIDARPQP